MILIYTHQITNRIKYTFDLIFNSILGAELSFTSDTQTFENYTGAKLSYTIKSINNELHFPSADLLFSEGVNQNALTYMSDSDFINTIDPFAFCFIMATRYEEYLPFLPDNHNRFSAINSIAYKNNYLLKPVVNILAEKIKKELLKSFPNINFPEKEYSYLPTIDIDNAYAYQGKSLTRTIGGYIRAISKSDKADVTKRLYVLRGKEKDPYDTYEYQMLLHDKYNLKPIYFFLLGDWATNDKNLPFDNQQMQSLIKKLKINSGIGIHPSYASNSDSKKIIKEKGRLEKITNQIVVNSRQHFLMLRFPDTYRNLIQAGITDDYTMGYADALGFRSGLCCPYKFYDLVNEKETALTIHPFAVMDGTLNSYLKLSPENAIEEVKKVIAETKKVNGEFISIWHNETLSDWREWKGWKLFYEEVLKAATPS